LFTYRWETLTNIGQSLAQIIRVRVGWQLPWIGGYESDETDTEVIFAAPDHIDHEEVESQASNEPELTGEFG